MKFSEFLEISETMTSTADVAGFSRRVGEVITRGCPKGVQDDKNKKKKPYRQPQLEE